MTPLICRKLNAVGLLILNLILSPAAQAVTVGGLLDRLFGPVAAHELDAKELAEELDRLAELPQKSLYNIDRWARTQTSELPKCIQQYEDFYQDGVLDISLVAGYLDMPNIGKSLDQDGIEMIYGALTRPCGNIQTGACGFEETQKIYPSKVILERSMGNLTDQAALLGLSDSSSLLRSDLRVRLTLTYSSWSNYDKDNFDGRKVRAEQIKTSEIAESAFFGSIGEASKIKEKPCDVCAYLGHARSGGGPDFRPVPLDWRKKEGDPDYAQYLKTRTNFRRLLRAMEASKHPTKQLIAVMGCDSEGNFYDSSRKACLVQGAPNCQAKTLKDYEKKMGLIVTNKLSWPQNQHKYLGVFFDGLLNMKCRSAWNENYKVLNSIPKYPETYRLIGNFL